MSKLFPSRLIAGTYNVYPEFKFKADKEPCTPRCTHASFRPESGFFRDQLATDLVDKIFSLTPGQVSDPISDPSGFYLVKLDERTPGRVRSFEEQKVQDEIRTKLRLEQYGRLRQQDLGRLMANSIVKPDAAVLSGQRPPNPTEQQMMNIALDMAMQKYYQYAAK